MNFGRQLTLGTMFAAIARADVANLKYEKPYSQLPIPKPEPKPGSIVGEDLSNLDFQYSSHIEARNWGKVKLKSMTPAPVRRVWIYR